MQRINNDGGGDTPTTAVTSMHLGRSTRGEISFNFLNQETAASTPAASILSSLAS